MVLHCVRNTHLENLHAGKKNGGDGGGFGDKDMKKLLIEVVDKTYTFLSLVFHEVEFNEDTERWFGMMRSSNANWNDPKLFEEWIKVK